MASSLSTFSLLLIFSLLTTFAAGQSDPHDYLTQYGLPKGLLPTGTVRYSYSPNGRFSLELAHPCYVTFGTDLVRYDRIIKGKFGDGAIGEIQGVWVKQFFVWAPITALATTFDGSLITVQVGLLGKNLPISVFESIPECNENPPAMADA